MNIIGSSYLIIKKQAKRNRAHDISPSLGKRTYGENLMVQPYNEISCLGFVDSRLYSKVAICT